MEKPRILITDPLDDELSLDLLNNGFKTRDSQNQEKVLKYLDLPPPLDLSSYLTVDTASNGSRRSSLNSNRSAVDPATGITEEVEVEVEILDPPKDSSRKKLKKHDPTQSSSLAEKKEKRSSEDKQEEKKEKKEKEKEKEEKKKKEKKDKKHKSEDEKEDQVQPLEKEMEFLVFEKELVVRRYHSESAAIKEKKEKEKKKKLSKPLRGKSLDSAREAGDPESSEEELPLESGTSALKEKKKTKRQTESKTESRTETKEEPKSKLAAQKNRSKGSVASIPKLLEKPTHRKSRSLVGGVETGEPKLILS